MKKVELTINCDEAITRVNKSDTMVKINLLGIDEYSLILEILDNVDIDNLLMHIDPISLKQELKRREDENKSN